MKSIQYFNKRLKIIVRKIKSCYYFWVFYNTILGIASRKRFENICIENLEIASNTLGEIKVRHWITDGTLLGFYRDGGLIKGDRDIDLGMMIEDLPTNIHHLFMRRGLDLLRENGSLENGLEYTYTRKGANLDIFLFYKDENYVWHANWLGTERIRFKYPVFRVKKWQFKLGDYWAPENIEQYLELKYGKNWRVPVGKWDWAKDPKNIF